MLTKELQELYARFESLVKDQKPSLHARGFTVSQTDTWANRLKNNVPIRLKTVLKIMEKMDNRKYIILANGEPIIDVFLKNLNSKKRALFKNTIKKVAEGKKTKGDTYSPEFMIQSLQEKGFEISLKKEKIADTQTQLTE